MSSCSNSVNSVAPFNSYSRICASSLRRVFSKYSDDLSDSTPHYALISSIFIDGFALIWNIVELSNWIVNSNSFLSFLKPQNIKKKVFRALSIIIIILIISETYLLLLY